MRLSHSQIDYILYIYIYIIHTNLYIYNDVYLYTYNTLSVSYFASYLSQQGILGFAVTHTTSNSPSYRWLCLPSANRESRYEYARGKKCCTCEQAFRHIWTQSLYIVAMAGTGWCHCGWEFGQAGAQTHTPDQSCGTSCLFQCVTWVMSDHFVIPSKVWEKCEFKNNKVFACLRVCVRVRGWCGIWEYLSSVCLLAAEKWLYTHTPWGIGRGGSTDTTKVQAENLLTVLFMWKCLL